MTEFEHEWTDDELVEGKNWLFTCADSLADETGQVEDGTAMIRDYLPRIGDTSINLQGFCNLVTNAATRKLRKVAKGY